MTIYEKIKDHLKNMVGEIISLKDIKRELKVKYDIVSSSIILADYCYNRYNDGIDFYQKRLFEYIDPGSYRYLGENYPYTGKIKHKSKDSKKEIVVGEWKNGELINFNK